MTETPRTELTAATTSERVKNIIGGLLLIGVGVFLGLKGQAGAGDWYWVGAVGCTLGGLGWALASGMKAAACPACGSKHWEISDGALETCHECEVYLSGDEQAIWLVDENHVADEPVFELELKEEFYWPACCSACGAEATRAIEVDFDTSQTGRNIALAAAGLAAGALVVRTGGGASVSVSVPHCDTHDNGAVFKKGDVLQVRSYAFLRGFKELNSDAAAA